MSSPINPQYAKNQANASQLATDTLQHSSFSHAHFSGARPIHDQAAGLRRLMVSPQPRVLSIISAAKAQPAKFMTNMMSNLAASLSTDGSDVLIMQNSPFPAVIKLKAPLIDHIYKPLNIAQITTQMAEGYFMASLLRHQQESTLDFEKSSLLDALFCKLAMQFQFVLVETKLNLQHKLPIKSINQGQIVIHLTSQAEDIKQAYQIIKQISLQHIADDIESQPLGILVSDTSVEKAHLIFKNIAQVAKRYLKLELEFIGVVPADDALAKAAKLGSSVINAFPFAHATQAFKAIAKRLDYRTHTQYAATHGASDAKNINNVHHFNDRLLSGSGIFEGAM